MRDTHTAGPILKGSIFRESFQRRKVWLLLQRYRKKNERVMEAKGNPEFNQSSSCLPGPNLNSEQRLSFSRGSNETKAKGAKATRLEDSKATLVQRRNVPSDFYMGNPSPFLISKSIPCIFCHKVIERF